MFSFLENEIRTSHIPACFVYMTAGVCELTKAGDSPSGSKAWHRFPLSGETGHLVFFPQQCLGHLLDILANVTGHVITNLTKKGGWPSKRGRGKGLSYNLPRNKRGTLVFNFKSIV